MSAPLMSGMKLLRKSLTYSKLNTLRLIVRRQCSFDHKNDDEKILGNKFVRDSEGAITAINEKNFPKHLSIDPDELDMESAHPERKLLEHSGLVRLKTVSLPGLLEDNIRLVLARNESLNKGTEAKCRHLLEVMKSRHPPEEERDISNKYRAILDAVIEEELKDSDISLEGMTDSQHMKFTDKVDGIARNMFAASHHNWKPIEVSGHNSLIYAGARLAPNYAVMLQVLHEIKRYDPEYVPDFVYNFGSGACSATWAVNTLWKDKVFQHFNIDPCKDINKLSQKLMANDIDEPMDSSIKEVHYRMFPSSSKNKYSLVISGYLMMEMLQKDRAQCIQKLWEQAGDYLVLIEYGSAAGYKLIMEARNIILGMMNKDPKFEGHVIAPCTHSLACPKQVMKNPVCNFEVPYYDMSFMKKATKTMQKKYEKYIYVIFKKGPKEKAIEYPRILDKKKRTKRTSCLLCCPDGEINHFVIGRGSAKNLHWSLKRASSGDRLPVLWSQFNPHTYAQERLKRRNGDSELSDMDRDGSITESESEIGDLEKQSWSETSDMEHGSIPESGRDIGDMDRDGSVTQSESDIGDMDK